MKRIWVVDDNIPVQGVFRAGRIPTRLDRAVLELVLATSAERGWDEPIVRDLCQTLCVDEFEAAFFTSPEAARRHLLEGDTPPDMIIFDWEGPGFRSELNIAVIGDFLKRSGAYIQVYTHLSEENVEPHLEELRRRFGKRVFPTKTKGAVRPAELRESVRREWVGTIAGQVADNVRVKVRGAVETALAEMSTMPQVGIAALVDGRPENLLSLMLAKVRDSLAADTVDVLEQVVGASLSGESSDALRRLMSAWYYFFPADDRVRRGDLIEAVDGDGGLWLVVTPGCDLAQFRRKTGGKLTLLRAVPIDASRRTQLRAAGMLPTEIGASITAPVQRVADSLVPLPNVPLQFGSRENLEDYLVLCHGWETIEARTPPAGVRDPLCYEHLSGWRRRCSVAEPFVGGAIGKIAAVMFSPGVPNLPDAERSRLKIKLAAE